MTETPVSAELCSGGPDDHGLVSPPEGVPVVDRCDAIIDEAEVLGSPIEVSNDARFCRDGVQRRSGLPSEVIDPLGSLRRCVEVESDIVRLAPQRIAGFGNEGRRPDRKPIL